MDLITMKITILYRWGSFDPLLFCFN
jgi:hypothetical protein